MTRKFLPIPLAVLLLGANLAVRANVDAPAPAAVPVSCSNILKAGASTGDGVYLIDPEQDASPISVYCDMTTDGGGWTLAGYGANANLGGKLTAFNGTYDPTNRTGSATINAVALAQASTEVSLSWSNAAANGGLGSYSTAISYEIPNPSAQTLDPQFGGFSCVGPEWSEVTINTLVGATNLPATMYTRKSSLGAVYGAAYGLSRSNGNPQCDWTVDGQAFRAVYLGNGSSGWPANIWSGVVSEPGGSANHVIPATMAIWFRGDISNALPGLVAHYSFDQNDAADSSGNNHHGTVQGGATFAAGPAGFGNALVVDLGRYVSLPSPATLSLSNHDFTVTAWVNSTAFSGLGGYGGDWAVLGGAGATSFNGLHLVLRGGQPYMGFFGNDLGSGNTLSLNTWYHVAYRYNKATGEMALFLNGNPVSSGGGHAPFIADGTTFIGRCCENWDQPRYAKGRIDDVQIYDRPLTASEIASLVSAPAPQDTTPPSITPQVTGTLGNNGWYRSDVAIAWTVTDAESTATATGCDAVSVTWDTAGETYTCSATSTGGSSSQSVTIKRDATAPSIAGSRSPAANGNGWNNSPVSVSFACTDALSGITSCVGDATLAAAGAWQEAAGIATDQAGNTASATVGGIHIDLTAPVITLSAPAGSYQLGDVVAAAYACADEASGVATCTGTVGAGDAIDTTSVGTKSFTVTSTDLAGNASTTTVTYTVAYVFGGFRQPLLPPVTAFKSGSTIPVKFLLRNAAGAPVTTAVATVSVNGGPALGTATWDGEQYHFNLKTKGLPTGALTIIVKTDDGMSQSVTVSVK